jgi:alkyl hydroperoxide reductase subunit AhpF
MLMGSANRADFVIIGAGIAGASAALYMTSYGNEQARTGSLPCKLGSFPLRCTRNELSMH